MISKHWEEAIVPLVALSYEGDIIGVNHAFAEMLGYSTDELTHQHIEKVMDNGAKFVFNSILYPKLRMEKKIQEIYLTLQHKNREPIYVIFNAQVIEPEHIIHCFVVPMPQRMEYVKEIRAINKVLKETVEEKTRLHEELVIVNRELKFYAERDFLTKLYNRRIFMKKAEQTYEKFQQSNRLFSFCILDVDFFKQVNDQYGHHMGDEVLMGLAEEMRNYFDSSCTLARFGGEEFIILLPDKNEKEAYEIADQFRERVKLQSWHGVSVTISLGVNMVSYPSEVSDIIVGADRALYKAKANGRDQVML